MKPIATICGLVFAVHALLATAQPTPVDEADDALIAWLDQAMSGRSTPRSAPPPAGPAAVRRSEDGQWQVELGNAMLPRPAGRQIPAELDERLQRIRLQLLLSPQRQGERNDISFRFLGQPLEYWYPEPAAVQVAPADFPEVDVVVSASHGWYFHHGFNDWRLQRPLSNGVVEDLITPAFADRLVALLQADGLRTLLTRSVSHDPDPSANKPWWEMAARYNAQALHPERPDIWQSYADRQTPLREYNDDIRTRPLLANAHRASAVIHLHTNAASADATGAMAFIQGERPQDRRLAHNVLCALRSAVQAVPGYQRYRVRVQPFEGNYGENRLAQMPSVLLEIGFHTNPEDAAALRDPLFQQAVAQGVRDGHAAFVAGQGEGGAPVCQ